MSGKANTPKNNSELNEPGIGMDVVLDFMLKTHSANGDISRSLNEIVTNAFDAKATKCYVKLGEYEGKPAVIFLDDGAGFMRENLVSVLSYAKSSRKRSDLETSGVNGTGTKSLLALGEFRDTKVTIYTRSDEYKSGVKVSFDYEYLASMAVKQPKLENCISYFSSNNGLFYQGWKRDTGSTLILTGFDPVKIRNNEDIIDALARRVSPRAARRVQVFKNGLFVPLKTKVIDGDPYSIDFDSDLLGHVVFELFHGGINDGPVICGRENSITEYNNFFAHLPLADRKRMDKQLWGSIGGHVYIPKANVYRLHDGTFSDKFYKSGASKELVSMFELVAKELEKFQEKIEDGKAMKEQMEILRAMVLFSNEGESPAELPKLPKTTPGVGMLAPIEFGSVAAEIFIVPKVVDVYLNESVSVDLKNLGTQKLNFKAALWKPENRNIIIVGNGKLVTINALDKVGPVNVTIKGDGWMHELTVRVKERLNGAYIAGESLVNPGTEHEYQLRKSDESSVIWKTGESRGVRIESGKTPYDAILSVSQDAPVQRFDLFCMSKAGAIIAKRSVKVTDKAGNREMIMSVGDYSYIVDSASSYPSCAVQIEDADEETLLPKIYVNGLHSQLRQVTWNERVHVMVSGIAFTAIGHQVSQKLISLQKGNAVAWEFIQRMKMAFNANRSKLRQK